MNSSSYHRFNRRRQWTEKNWNNWLENFRILWVISETNGSIQQTY